MISLTLGKIKINEYEHYNCYFKFNFYFSDDVMAMFDERDKDHDGFLSFEEFSGQETKMERAFKSMDKDGDGFITKAEFKLVCKNLTKGIIKLICWFF